MRQVRALLEVRVVIEGGSYMRKYGIQKINHTTERIHLENMYLRITYTLIKILPAVKVFDQIIQLLVKNVHPN